jgi:hypothetical protein
MKKSKILMALGAAMMVTGFHSTALAGYSIASLKESFTESVVGMKDSFTDTMGKVTDSVSGSVTEMKTSLADSITGVQEQLGSGSLPFSPKAEKLTADEVRALFVGNTVDTQNRETRMNSITYYHPNGQATQKRLWSTRSGRWSIGDNGQICLAFGNRSMKCRHIVREADRYYKVRSNADGELRKIVRYRAFVDGNLLREGS